MLSGKPAFASARRLGTILSPDATTNRRAEAQDRVRHADANVDGIVA
jgi:hypothetical protein